MDVAKLVMKEYPLNVKKVSLLSDKGKKAVWLILAGSKKFILKKVPIREGRLRFMTHAIQFMKNNGVRTPQVIKTKKGRSYVRLDEQYFVLFEAITGKKPSYQKRKQLQKIVLGLATFHKASTGINIPIHSEPSILLGGWRDEFIRRHQLMKSWKVERSHASSHNEFDQQFLNHVDFFLTQCEKAIDILDESYYVDWNERTKRMKMLCHQDFAAGNLMLDDEGNLHVFDMDSLTIDLPARDIRKILNKVMKKQEEWNLDLMIEMMMHYQKVNPLSKEQYEVVLADLLFPHLFYGQISKYYGKETKEWSEEKHLQRLIDTIKLETSKEHIIRLFQDHLDENNGL
ncbi:CotS family spore coat protein [Halalkalibacter krulwichiae]|uniref:Spore coat protein S n=1 Tax=Halalkalibacter krulwichiae TaxID=199441 RepID=A0A1X9MGI3_9BACI|nr:CotS family spore coat protein [Halalkalibacter krulwichiae]ARK30621.1 Spore coat protein S [Halalkalibacter krulwichiae]